MRDSDAMKSDPPGAFIDVVDAEFTEMEGEKPSSFPLHSTRADLIRLPRSKLAFGAIALINNLLRKIFVVFWIIYFVAPLSGGFPFRHQLEYHWLPNESFDEEFHEMLSSRQKCRTLPDEDVECAQVADAWRDKHSGNVYTPEDFKQHRLQEAIRMLLPWSIYGFVGCLLAGAHAFILRHNPKFALKTCLITGGIAAFYVMVMFFDISGLL
jgi:hypothetical protein